MLQAVDLPGGGWEADAAPEPPAGWPGDDDALDGFPEQAVVDTAESARFTRGTSLAWSAVWRLDSEAAAALARQRLGEPSFVEIFLTSLGGGDPVVEGSHATLPGPPPVHVDLVPSRAGLTVSLLVLASSPEPFPDADATAERLRNRLA